MKDFCDIKTRDDFADYFDIPRNKLTYVLYKKGVENYYKSFEIPKKRGGSRHISAPHGYLKFIQKKLASTLYDCENYKTVRVCNISHGFEKDKSIITNALVHRNKKYVLNIDLKDFFDSFHFGRVRGFFNKDKKFSFPIEIATIIAQLTCFNGVLPQGASTSPVITNLMCKIFDFRILKIAKKYKVDYTRYADDLTFSTNDKHFIEHYKDFLSIIQEEVERAGFFVNDEKIRLQFKDSQQIVTGIVVNKKINVSKSYYKVTRAMARSLYSQGEFTIDGVRGTLSQLEGRFSFIDSVSLFNNRKDKQKHNFFSLSSREREYSLFIFYKYFCVHNRPVIITEGKTDIRYLKAALKKMYAAYPNLISRDKNGKFEFKISFFNRSKKVQYFLGVPRDGGDGLKNIYQLFFDNQYNYYKYFSDLRKNTPLPIILLYDNETVSRKPLKVFTQHAHMKDADIELLKKDLYFLLHKEANLYLATNNLVSGKNECEIEELFPQAVLDHKIDGKTFSLKGEDSSRHYSKEIFSKYIYSHYSEIDFNNFCPLLEALSKIVN